MAPPIVVTSILPSSVEAVSQQLDAVVSTYASTIERRDKAAVTIKEVESDINSFDKAAIDKKLGTVAKAKAAKPARTEQERGLRDFMQGHSLESEKHNDKVVEMEALVAKFEDMEEACKQGEEVNCPECESTVSIEHCRTKAAEKAAIVSIEVAARQSMSIQ